MVYSKSCEILSKNKDIYTKIILLTSGFHQLRVMQRLLYKRHFPKGYRKWCADAKTIAEGSIDQAFAGCHYYQSMRMHKECFDALVQSRIENVSGQFRSYSVFLNIFRNHQRITKRLKTTVNRSFCPNLFSFSSFEAN